MKKIISLVLAFSFLFLSSPVSYAYDINPTLKYQNAGSYEHWTEESYYSSPAVEDIDGDGKKEIIFSNYSITVLGRRNRQHKVESKLR